MTLLLALFSALAMMAAQSDLGKMMHRVMLVFSATLAVGQMGFALTLPQPVEDEDFLEIAPDEARLGQLLFFDPILSGNREVACATCHHPDFGTSDGLSLGIGDGGIGLGPERRVNPENPPEQRIPRHSQALWNLGAKEFHTLFHDGRVEMDELRPYGMRTPLDEDMLRGFSGLLSAQNMFPVLSGDEMAGHYSENEISQAVRQGLITGPDGAWALIADRIRGIEAYTAAFIAAYDHIETPEDIAFTDISNAVAAFVAFEFRSDTAPFDAYLRGQADLPPLAQEGMALFYGDLGCASCHSGPFQTDHDFHATGAPQIGPGKRERFETHARDDGRMRVTGQAEDIAAFRTPSLRNVMLTAPYGHAGAHRDLAVFLADHAAPRAGLARYDRAQAILPDMPVSDWAVMDDPAQVAALMDAISVPDRVLASSEITALIAFLETLTDPIATAGRLGVPSSVPSGLTVPNP